jgi:hypothetical protein
MGWLLLVIIIIAAFAVPRFGKAVLVFLGIVLLGVAIFAWLYESDKRDRAERAVARTRITPAEVELVGLALQPSSLGGSYTLIGRVRNRSTVYTLTKLQLKLMIRDCQTSTDCEIVGETEESVYTNVPPGQARDLDQYVHFSGLRQPHGKYRWDYHIVEIIGQ